MIISDGEDDTPIQRLQQKSKPTDPLRPWRVEFLSYIETLETTLLAGMSTIQWWGVSIVDYTAPQFVTDHIPLKINDRGTQFGHHLLKTIYRSCHHQSQVNGYFQVLELPSVSDGISSRGI
jgi:hypothetical protein